MLILETRRPGGRVLLGGASLPYRSIGVLKKKFAEFFGNSNLSWYGCRHGTRGGVFAMRQTRNSRKVIPVLLRPKGDL
jgi:hypothetical protein